MKIHKVHILLVAALLLTIPVCGCKALTYEDEPYFIAYIPTSTYLEKGEENQIYIVIQNQAILKEITYDTYQQYVYLSNRTDLLTTAYNVTISINAPEGIEVQAPLVKVNAIPVAYPVKIPVKIKVRDFVKAGDYDLNITINYEVFDEVFFEVAQYTPPQIQYTKQVIYIYNQTTGALEEKKIINETMSPIYWYPWVEIKFKEKTQNISVKVHVKEAPVKLRIVNVKASEMIAGGKGRIDIQVKNAGEKIARNLFLVLSTPSGFRSLSTFQKSPDIKTLKPMLELMKMQAKMMGKEIEIPEVEIPPELIAAITKGSYYIGDLEPGQTANASFIIDIETEEGGYYPFQIQGVYLDEYGEAKQTDPVAFGVFVESKPEAEIVEFESAVYPGTKGNLRVKLKFNHQIENLRAKLEVEPPIIACVKERYIGTIKSNCTLDFVIKASDDAEPGVYPGKIKLYYKISDKEITDEIDVGIKVLKEMKFELEGVPEIGVGEEKVITVKIINAGKFKVREATARITVVDPFSTTDDTAYIGDLEPGEGKNISFKLKVSKDATPKLYALNLEVKYKDPYDEWVISKPIKMPILVKKKGKLIGIVGILGSMIAIMGVFITYKKINKKNSEEQRNPAKTPTNCQFCANIKCGLKVDKLKNKLKYKLKVFKERARKFKMR